MKLETKKYIFTVEGETEQWYLEWLREQINQYPSRTCNISIEAKVQQSPKKFYKSTNVKVTPRVTHICDVESNDRDHVDKFQRILSEMKEARMQKGISYILGYSNFTFELWIILHKRDCGGTLSHRSNYLDLLRRIFDEHFETLGHYKRENTFKRCLKKISLDDVKSAIRRAEAIMNINDKEEKVLIKYKGYAYYRDNPALSVHEIIKQILIDCGIMLKR